MQMGVLLPASFCNVSITHYSIRNPTNPLFFCHPFQLTFFIFLEDQLHSFKTEDVRINSFFLSLLWRCGAKVLQKNVKKYIIKVGYKEVSCFNFERAASVVAPSRK
jgi:hypothetical protein